MFSALVALNLFGAGLILEAIHLPVTGATPLCRQAARRHPLHHGHCSPGPCAALGLGSARGAAVVGACSPLLLFWRTCNKSVFNNMAHSGVGIAHRGGQKGTSPARLVVGQASQLVTRHGQGMRHIQRVPRAVGGGGETETELPQGLASFYTRHLETQGLFGHSWVVPHSEVPAGLGGTPRILRHLRVFSGSLLLLWALALGLDGGGERRARRIKIQYVPVLYRLQLILPIFKALRAWLSDETLTTPYDRESELSAR